MRSRRCSAIGVGAAACRCARLRWRGVVAHPAGQRGRVCVVAVSGTRTWMPWSKILWGTEDAWIPTALAHKLAALIPGASLHLVEGAGHLIQYDAPIALADHLRAWLTHVAS
ncbi:alpha/beta fold hydrolase [Kribbella sp. NPDC023855]|uniref:alpha/beta fold hydrolase n=1 Tax=Kribbella sp. NPDC023855 TaxID=3154698 RepID=UPI0034001853